MKITQSRIQILQTGREEAPSIQKQAASVVIIELIFQ